MDSGNSGSLPSSSGGDGGDGGGGGGADEVFDSRTNSMFVNTSTNFYQPPPPPSSSSSHKHQQPPSTFFNPTSFSQPMNPNTNPMYNLESLWSRNPNPDPIYNLDSHQDPIFNPNPVDNSTNNINPDTVPAKNPKKRTRASRRAPTTVLTTDTSNFRQMVQEFTGIPAAPFSGATSSSPFSHRRSLYGGGITPVQTLRPSALYLNSANATTSSFNLPPSENHGFTKQPLNLSNLQNQMFPFQSLPQTSLPQQINVTERENQQTEAVNVFPGSSSTSLTRWRGDNENLMSFEGVIGNTPNAVISSRSDGDKLPGNEDPWICPSD